MTTQTKTDAMRRVRAVLVGASIAIMAGCGGRTSPSDEPRAARADALQTGTGGAESSEGTADLGELEPVPTPAADETPAEPTTRAVAENAEPELIQVPATGAEAEDVPLTEGAFAFQGFRVVGVPRRTVARRLSTAPNIWEIKSRDGKRIALIQQVPWSRVEGQALPATGAATQQRTERRMSVDDWGGRNATIIVERFTTTLYEYRVERLTTRSDWIVSGWQDESQN